MRIRKFCIVKDTRNHLSIIDRFQKKTFEFGNSSDFSCSVKYSYYTKRSYNLEKKYMYGQRVYKGSS